MNTLPSSRVRNPIHALFVFILAVFPDGLPRWRQAARRAALGILILGAGAVLALAPAVAAEPVADSPAMPEMLQFVDDTSFMVVSVNTSDLIWKNPFQASQQVPPEVRQILDGFTNRVEQQFARLKAATQGEVVRVVFGLPRGPGGVLGRTYLKNRPGVERNEFQSLMQLPTPVIQGEHFVFERVFPRAAPGGPVAILADDDSSKDSSDSADPTLRVLEAFVPVARPGLAEAAAAVAEYPAQLVFSLPDTIRRTFEELQPPLPPALGGGSSRVITDGARWLAIGVDPAVPKGVIVIQSASDSAAQTLAEQLPDLVRGLLDLPFRQAPGVTEEVRNLLVQVIQPQVAGSRITIDLSGEESLGVFMTAATLFANGVHQSIVKDERLRQFKDIMLAMHNFHSAHGCFPPSAKQRNADGQNGLSWRVHLLPYLGQGELHRQFHLDEPWDSPHNLTLLEKMPEIYRSIPELLADHDSLQPGQTMTLAPRGEKTLAGTAEPVRIRDVIDGLGNTVALVEVEPSRAVPWTSPQDFEFNPDQPSAGLMLRNGNLHQTAFVDGTSCLLSADLPSETWLNLFQINDGNSIGPF